MVPVHASLLIAVHRFRLLGGVAKGNQGYRANVLGQINQILHAKNTLRIGKNAQPNRTQAFGMGGQKNILRGGG